MTQVKICGLSTPGTVDAALAAGASHLGFVSFPASPRHLAPELLRALAARVPPHVMRVGVLVDPDDALLDAVSPALDAIQFHGRETPERLARVRARTGCRVWRAVGVASRADIAAATAAADAADLLLFDAKAPSGAALPGGNGVRFDWSLLAGLRIGGDWGLSGGLDAGSVGEAIGQSGAPLVDVSSGVEDAPGVKSVEKMRAFIAAARG